MRLYREAVSDPKDHFLGIRKMVDLGSGAKREIDNIALTRKERIQRKISTNSSKVRMITA
jgi:hypothetical protein